MYRRQMRQMRQLQLYVSNYYQHIHIHTNIHSPHLSMTILSTPEMPLSQTQQSNAVITDRHPPLQDCYPIYTLKLLLSLEYQAKLNIPSMPEYRKFTKAKQQQQQHQQAQHRR